jgi:regulator of sigma E protease
MADFVISVLAFLVAIGVIVTVHELGHYSVARLCGVRVLRFSIGFGRALWSRTLGRDRTEWVIAAVPLGGYVKMLDEREVEVPADQRHRAFNTQPVGRRAAIVAAGPAINIVLAVVAYTVMFIIGVQGVVPRVGGVEPNTPAAEAGFEGGDRIVALGDRATATWSQVRLALLDRALGEERVVLPVRVERSGGFETTLRLDVRGVALDKQDADPIARLGFERWLPEMPAEIGRVVAASPAAAAGLQSGDTIVSAGGMAISHWQGWVDFVRARPGETFEVTVARDGERRTLELTPEQARSGGDTVGRIGAAPPSLSGEDRAALLTTVRHGPVSAVGQAVGKTWQITALTGRVVYRMMTGQVSLRNISGPVTIGRYAGQSAQIGLATFLGFIGLISVSIGLVNLLPIPVLDGGHLVFYAVEALKGSAVSERAQGLAQQVGIALLIALMTLALYNDFLRLVD